MNLNHEASLYKFLGQIASDLYQAPSENDAEVLTTGYPEGVIPGRDSTVAISLFIEIEVAAAATWGPDDDAGRWNSFVWG